MYLICRLLWSLQFKLSVYLWIVYIFVGLSIEASATCIYLHQFCLVYNKLLYDFRSWVVVMDDKSFLYNYKSKLIIILASKTFYRIINIPCEVFFCWERASFHYGDERQWKNKDTRVPGENYWRSVLSTEGRYQTKGKDLQYFVYSQQKSMINHSIGNISTIQRNHK